MSDLWQAARKQVGEFEQRSAELALVLATEKQALEAVEREVKKIEEGARRQAEPPPAVERWCRRAPAARLRWALTCAHILASRPQLAQSAPR